jgi:hypothetical protein
MRSSPCKLMTLLNFTMTRACAYRLSSPITTDRRGEARRKEIDNSPLPRSMAVALWNLCAAHSGVFGRNRMILVLFLACQLVGAKKSFGVHDTGWAVALFLDLAPRGGSDKHRSLESFPVVLDDFVVANLVSASPNGPRRSGGNQDRRAAMFRTTSKL